MFAIVETSGKQYRVCVNDSIIVDRVPAEVGSKFVLDKILLISNDSGSVSFGSPTINGAKVEVEVVKAFKGKKVIAFKKRRRKNSRRKRGHRQQLTELKVLSISEK